MSDLESREGYKVRSITMHGDTLTWLIVNGIVGKKSHSSKKKSQNIYVRQCKFKSNPVVDEVLIDEFNFFLNNLYMTTSECNTFSIIQDYEREIKVYHGLTPI
jgi:hypothetical protein